MSLLGAYIGWVGHENLGDEAMFAACRELFPEIEWHPLDYHLFARSHGGRADAILRALRQKLRPDPRDYWPPTNRATSGLPFPAVAILGGGTTINEWPSTLSAYRASRRVTRRMVPVFGTGVQPPGYWAAETNWRDLRREWVAALAELPVVGVRGPHSEALLREAGLSNVRVSGDPCVLLHSPLAQSRPAASPFNVTVNIGSTLAVWGDAERLHRELQRFVTMGVAEGWRISLLPIDPKDREACERIASGSRLPPTAVLSTPATFAEFRSLTADADALVAFKLHAAVLAAAANIPFVMLEYRPKCRDFAASIAWEKHTISTADVLAMDLLERVGQMCSQRVHEQECLAISMANQRRTFLEYCDTIRPLLRHS